MRLVPFSYDHLDVFEQSDADIERYGKLTSETPLPMAEYGVAYTAIHDGRVLGIGAVLQQSERVGKCFTMMSRYAPAYGSLAFYTAKRMLDQMMTDMHLHRLETANLKEAEDQHRWCKLLGFAEEGEMPYYDDKKRTYIRFAKIRG